MIIVGELNLNICGCKEQNVLFTQKEKKRRRAQRKLIPLNFRQIEERDMARNQNSNLEL